MKWSEVKDIPGDGRDTVGTKTFDFQLRNHYLDIQERMLLFGRQAAITTPP